LPYRGRLAKLYLHLTFLLWLCLWLIWLGISPVAAQAGAAELGREGVRQTPLWLEQLGTWRGLAALKDKVAALEAEYRENLKVKGIYIPGKLVPSAAFPRLVELVEQTELNAVVIDVKGDEGYLYFDTELPLVEEIGAERVVLRQAEELLADLAARGIYTIARLVVFKDTQLGQAKPEWAIQDAAGRPWRDRSGQIWMNPYNEQVWAYNLAVARAAAALGFKEIQFDYVRFPSDGPVGQARYPGRDQRAKSVVIAQFLARAREELSLYGVYVSADIFGQVPSVPYDMGIGQQWELLAGTVDFLSPMVYPSHYAPGVYGLPDPDADPYRTVLRTVQDAFARYEQLLAAGLPERLTARLGEVPEELVVTRREQLAAVRPWLQDFTLRHPYGPAEVRAQIEAAYQAGADQWLLWNPNGNYSESALQPAQQPPD